MPRRTTRINYDYLDRLFAALDRVGINPRELPTEFVRMAWEAKMDHLRSHYDVSICARCKLPRPEDEMDFRYNLCKQCALTLHRKPTRDPRVIDMLLNHRGAQDAHSLDSSSHELLRKLAPKVEPVTSSADDVLERASRRRG
jgi:hypothetical protein